MSEATSKGTLFVLIAVIACLSVVYCFLHKEKQNNSVQDVSMMVDHILLNRRVIDPVAIYPEETKCITIIFEDRKYAVYLVDLTVFSVFNMEMDGWVYRQSQNEWECLFSTRVYGVRDGKVEFDEQNGLVTLVGQSYDKFNGVKVFSFDLRTAER